MKIAVLTSGILPVPAVQGGAVENLVDFYLEYNEQHQIHDITIYSVWHPSIKKLSPVLASCNHFYYINTSSLIAKVKRKFYALLHHHEYYNPFIEYFFECAWQDIKKKQYDCIILENRPGYTYKLSQRGYSNLILHLHNDYLHKEISKARIIIENLRMVITVSNYIAQQVKTISDNYPTTFPKVVTVYNGINLQQFNKKERTKITRPSLGFADSDFVLVYSGRLNKEKGIAHLIDAMLLLNDISSIKLMIIGSTFFGNETNEDTFVRTLKEKSNPIKDRLVFTGFIPYEHMPEFLQLADISVIPSICAEAFGMTVAEAQAMGLPTITTNRGGIPEIVSSDSAIVVPTDNHLVQHLADAIRKLYNTPELRSQMSTAAKLNAAKYNKEQYARNFFNALESL